MKTLPHICSLAAWWHRGSSSGGWQKVFKRSVNAYDFVPLFRTTQPVKDQKLTWSGLSNSDVSSSPAIVLIWACLITHRFLDGLFLWQCHALCNHPAGQERTLHIIKQCYKHCKQKCGSLCLSNWHHSLVEKVASSQCRCVPSDKQTWAQLTHPERTSIAYFN